MKLKSVVNHNADILIIGGGGAGLRTAIAAREKGAEVLLVSKSRAGYANNTAIAGGAFAVAGGWREPRDSPEVHFQDTLRSGRFLNNAPLVRVLTQGIIPQVYDLERFGVKLLKTEGTYRVGHVPGHTYPRNIRCVELIGYGLSIPMRRYALGLGIKFLEGVLVTQLIKRNSTIVGAMGLDGQGQVYCLQAKATILATGGLGQIYQQTNNAVEATGDGYVLAYEAGLSLQDMEFIQFYPTCLVRQGPTMGLVAYEMLVFLAGAAIRNSLGQDIVELYGLRDTQRMTRDRISQAIIQEIKAGRSLGGLVSLDLASIPQSLRERYCSYLPKGTSYEQGSLLVSPAVHYAMGGVQINKHAETSLDGLYAAGEVCGGLQGANRLGGNAIAEIFVFGAIAGQCAAERAKVIPMPGIDEREIKENIAQLEGWRNNVGQEKVSTLTAALKKTMWENAGVIREERGLQTALTEIADLRLALDKVGVSSIKEWLQAIRLDKMLTVSEMVVRSALMRQESRGAHYRSDHPDEKNPDWLCNIVIRQDGAQMVLVPKGCQPAPSPGCPEDSSSLPI